LTSDSTEQVSDASGKSKKINRATECCHDIGQKPSVVNSSKMSQSLDTDDPTLFAGDFRAKTHPWQESAKAWLEREQDSGGSSIAFLQSLSLASASSKTCPACLALMEGEISSSLFEGWRNSGIASRGQCWTLNTVEWRNGATACSLSEVLETDVAPKYFLSPKACVGILRRAEKRGKALPALLEAALKAVAFGQPT
jgi:hypothetical protein